MSRLLLPAFVALSLAVTASSAQALDLTGIWHTRTGATFYVRQVGSEIWWYGTQAPAKPRWTNVASGKLNGDVLRVRWIDVPQGITRNLGTLALKVMDGNHLIVSENPNDFLSADWFR